MKRARISDVVVEVVFARVGAEADLVELCGFEVDKVIDEVVGKDLSLGEEAAVLVEGFEGAAEAFGDGLEVGGFFRWEVVEVFIDGLAGIDLVFDAIEAGHEDGGEGEVGIGGRIGGAEFDASGGGAGAVGGDAADGGAVAGGVGEDDGCLESRDEAFVGIIGGIGEGAEGGGVFEDAADVVQAEVTEAGVAIAGHDGGIAFPEGGVDMHAGAVVAVEGLGHEGGGFAEAGGDIFDHVFVFAEAVAHGEEGIEAEVDFALAAGGDLMVLGFDHETDVLHGGDHFVPEVHKGIHGGDGEVAFLVGDFVAEVGHFPGSGIPDTLAGIDVVKGLVGCGAVADIIEDEKLGFGAEAGAVGDAGGGEVFLGFDGDAARGAGIGIAGDGILDIAGQAEGGAADERIDKGGAGVGNDEHIGGFDALPTADGGAVEAEAFLEDIGGELGGGDGEVLPAAVDVTEFKIDECNFLFAEEGEDFLRRHG